MRQVSTSKTFWILFILGSAAVGLIPFFTSSEYSLTYQRRSNILDRYVRLLEHHERLYRGTLISDRWSISG